MTAPTRDEAAALDAADPLAAFADRFVAAERGLVYLDGNSLGRVPATTPDRVASVIRDEWAGRLVRGWHEWIDLSESVGDALGAAVLGAAPGQVAVCDSTTVNLYKLAVAALDARPGRSVIVTDTANFPTDRYVAEGIAAARGATVRWIDPDPVDGPSVADVEGALAPGDVALVTLSHVAFKSAAVADAPAITAAAHAAGALVLWDLSHAAGSVPVALDDWDADLAVGCTYKYLNAGPGAPAYLYVNRRLHADLRQPIWGWFGQRDQFAMGAAYDPTPGMARYLAGTPGVVGIACVDEGVRVIAEAGMDAIRAKGIALTEMAVRLHDGWLAALGFTLASPREGARRGSHVGLRHTDAWPMCQALLAANVVPDFRTPDVVRLGFSPLTTSFVDVWDGMATLERIARTGAHRAFPAAPAKVT